jgi:TrmH family RNA methyltransferase
MTARPHYDIDSPRHPAVRRLRGLDRDRSRRDRGGVLIAWGLHLMSEALDAGAPIREAWAGPALAATDEGRALFERLTATRAPIRRVAGRVLEAVAPGSGDQGILLVIGRTVRDAGDLLRPGASLLVALHGVQDPGNLGGILRTAWALGADAAVACEGCADPFGGRVVRAAMGAHFRMPIACAPAAPWLDRAAAAGLRVVAADAVSGAAPDRIDLGRPLVLLLGGEGSGLPEPLLRRAAERVRIPMTRSASSLNVHAAAAALLYEIDRQRGGVR